MAGAVAVTGIGLFTPAGGDRETTWETVRAGKQTAGVEEWEGLRYLTCRAPAFPGSPAGPAASRRPDRSAGLALCAAREALADAGFAHGSPGGPWGVAADPARVGVVAGIGVGPVLTYEEQRGLLGRGGPWGMSPYAVPGALPNAVAAQLSVEFGARGPSMTVTTACAAGATAIGTALDLLTLGRCDVVLAGGTDAPLSPYYLAGFDRLGALSRRFHDPGGGLRPFDVDRSGFVMGEGAGFLVLERPADAAARGARVRALVRGYGATSDAHHLVAPRPDGEGLSEAVLNALSEAGATPSDVTLVNAHGTGTPLGDAAEAKVLASLLPHHPPVTSTKGVTGHLLGAAGAVEAALTVLSVEESTIPPTANHTEPGEGITLNIPTATGPTRPGLAVSTSVGFGGHNAALVFGAG
ncbi:MULTISPECIES: beta-ketoacyl-[acyl-carrier-protein] synthase family protein [unclassified Streptomyces]|uniref:beta-ketoacyl-[acyl-carrier-protein] synthase family protein n=1 Tax=unclassified Streptomyces TaxID=2593676 RepID=UPI001CB73145|nr:MULTISPECIES: beta-ketoacyl-[acyl-carrier-protein] synthase family protein [unclassified Streptomyces]MBD0708037.1 3-oxoacyl-ACP synthase [Streptomyces sp. CBMA291]MBD0715869.1 3-oxoacyl-ACP synthase [Streptomyces sp. CBMA370]